MTPAGWKRPTVRWPGGRSVPNRFVRLSRPERWRRFPVVAGGLRPRRTLRAHSPPGKKAGPSRSRVPDANGSPQSAEYPTVAARGGVRAGEVVRRTLRVARDDERATVSGTTPGASGWDGPCDRTVRAGTHIQGRNRMAPVEAPTRKRPRGPRERAPVNSPSGTPTTSVVGELKHTSALT